MRLCQLAAALWVRGMRPCQLAAALWVRGMLPLLRVQPLLQPLQDQGLQVRELQLMIGS